ncbi:uncharacterized protein BDR25DRAFT_360025 [Lindgomyces ingoldianus]|uniref:Uncharacterized protein n=1 Tax=Lindgomyces ingoldianus TaxID=673940 RepID=A0ACB6QH81_9PLEO|nr:uncharacterized protein BDR25DRAFT_360025 [Lindgomyces ingoldianus]KAF2465865.1 hypothetical protein BDR25DRAFT_360025 [Lindgomyces ingoldianus]
MKDWGNYISQLVGNHGGSLAVRIPSGRIVCVLGRWVWESGVRASKGGLWAASVHWERRYDKIAGRKRNYQGGYTCPCLRRTPGNYDLVWRFIVVFNMEYGRRKFSLSEVLADGLLHNGKNNPSLNGHKDSAKMAVGDDRFGVETCGCADWLLRYRTTVLTSPGVDLICKKTQTAVANSIVTIFCSRCSKFFLKPESSDSRASSVSISIEITDGGQAGLNLPSAPCWVVEELISIQTSVIHDGMFERVKPTMMNKINRQTGAGAKRYLPVTQVDQRMAAARDRTFTHNRSTFFSSPMRRRFDQNAAPTR